MLSGRKAQDHTLIPTFKFSLTHSILSHLTVCCDLTMMFVIILNVNYRMLRYTLLYIAVFLALPLNGQLSFENDTINIGEVIISSKKENS